MLRRMSLRRRFVSSGSPMVITPSNLGNRRVQRNPEIWIAQFNWPQRLSPARTRFWPWPCYTIPSMLPRALVVEDDLSTRDALRLIVEGEGFQVDAVGDGEQALGLLERQNYSVILLDI